MVFFACRNRNFSPMQRRSLAKFGSLMLLAVAHWAAEHGTVAKSLVMVLDLLPAFPIMMMILVVSQYLTRETDEFIRLLVMRSLLWGIGATLAATSVWGFLENFVAVRHMELFLVYPMFCFFEGIFTPMLKARYR